jgi:hypothetical protein
MSDDRKDELPPFVQNDDSATMIANFAARRRRAYAAALAYSGSGPIMPLPLQGEGRFTADARVLPDWTAQRAEIIGLLDAIETGFEKIGPFLELAEAAYREGAAQLGHNKPPEPIDTLPVNAEELEIGALAANLARAEFEAEHPRFEVIRLCVRILKWVGAKLNVFLDDFLKEGGKRVAQAVVLSELLEHLHIDLTNVLTKVHHVFELLHLPF